MEKNRNSRFGNKSILDLNNANLYKCPIIINPNGSINITYNDDVNITDLKNLTNNPPRNSFLVERLLDSQNITNLIKTSNVVVNINGMGGLGKTELAKEIYWKENDKGDFERFAWVNYYENLECSFLSCFNFNLDSYDNDSDSTKFRKLLNKINSLNGKTLLIIDNFKANIDIDIFRSECNVISGLNSNIKVILTSREQVTGFREYKLGFLDEKQSKDLFYSYYIGEKNDTSLTEIFKLIGYHTLTIELLAKTAKECAYPITKLLSVVKEIGFNVSEVMEEEVEYDRYQDYFFNHLSRLFSFVELSEEELYVLKNFSILPSVPIRKEDMKTWIGVSNNKAVNSLLRKGWINEETEKNIDYVRCHQLICEIVLREFAPNIEVVENLITEVCNLLVVQYGESRIQKAKYLEIGSSIISKVRDRTPLMASLLNNTALTYSAVGDYNKSLFYQLEATEIIEDIFNDDHYELGVVYNNLASCYNDKSDYNMALKYAQSSKGILEKYGNKADLVKVFSTLSIVYLNLGDYDNSLKFGLIDKTVREEYFGKTSLEVAICYNNLSMLYLSKGCHREALNYALISRDIKENCLGELHSSLAINYNNLFLLYRTIGEFSTAYNYHIKTDKIISETLNKEHPFFIGHYSNLCALYIDLNRVSDALEVGLKAEKLIESNLNVTQELNAFLYTSLCIVYMKKKNFITAKEYAFKDIDLSKRIYGSNHIMLSVPYNNLSMIYRELNELNEALKYGLLALEIRENHFKISHEKLATSYNNLMLIYSDVGNRKKAIDYGLKSNMMFREIFGEKSREYITTSINLGNLYFENGSMKKALELIENAEKFVNQLEPKSMELMYSIYSSLYSIYSKKSNVKKAKKYLSLAINIKGCN